MVLAGEVQNSEERTSLEKSMLLMTWKGRTVLEISGCRVFVGADKVERMAR